MEEATMSDMNMAMGTNPGDEGLMVKFYERAVEKKAESKIQGRPIFEDKTYISIIVPGQKSGVERPKRPTDEARFAAHWRAYKERIDLSEAVVGTPLKEWPLLSRSQVEALAFHNVFSVEQLSSVSDGANIQVLGINSLKQQAKAFLEVADKQAAVNQIIGLKEELVTKDEQLAALGARLDALETEPKKPKRKRRTKAEIAADKAAEQE